MSRITKKLKDTEAHQGLPGAEVWAMSTYAAGFFLGRWNVLQLVSGEACTVSRRYIVLKSSTIYNVNTSIYLIFKVNLAVEDGNI